MITIKLEEIKKTFDNASNTLSAVNRQIAFAGVGVVWIFVKIIDGKLHIDNILLYAMMFFVGALLFDIVQYAYKTIFFECFRRYHEKKIDKNGYNKNILEEPVLLNNCWNIPTWVFFTLKILFVIIGYCNLLIFICKNLKISNC